MTLWDAPAITARPRGGRALAVIAVRCGVRYLALGVADGGSGVPGNGGR